MSQSGVATGSAVSEPSNAPGVTRRHLLASGAAASAGAATMAALDASPSQAQGSTELTPTSVKTGSYTASPGDFVPVDASVNSVTIALPNEPPDQTQVGVTVVAIAGPNVVNVACGPSDVLSHTGGARALALSSLGQGVLLQYQANADIWHAIAQNVLRLHTGGSPSNAGFMIENYGNAIQVAMQTDWSANTTGNTTYDSVDIFHKSAGDAIYLVNAGGVAAAMLATGSVGADNGITYVAAPALSGAQQNAITVAHAASGANSALTVAVTGSAITVNLATDGSSNAISTASSVIAAVNAAPSAQALVKAYNTTTGDGTSRGTGTVRPMGTTSLSGGFTGSTPGARSAINAWVPFWLDDYAGSAGEIVNWRHGQVAVRATNYAAFSPDGVAVQIDHTAGGPAILMTNQQPDPSGLGYPVDGSAPSIWLHDYSSGASLHVTRETPPLSNGGSGTPYGASVIDIICKPSVPFPVLMARRTVDGQGLYVKNDGTATFGIASNPRFGRVWIDLSNPGGAANCLVLANPSSMANSGAQVSFAAGGVLHGVVYSNYNPAAQTAQLTIGVLSAGSMAKPLVVTPTVIACTAELTVTAPPKTNAARFVGVSGAFAMVVAGQDYGPKITTTSDGGTALSVMKEGAGGGTAVVISNQGSGVTLDIQVGATPTSAIQILANGQIKFALSSNEAQGSATAGLGANCPAANPTAPALWQMVTTADGSQGYIPIWK